jgi:hypothetical protein
MQLRLCLCVCSHHLWLRSARPEGKVKTLMRAISEIDDAMMR